EDIETRAGDYLERIAQERDARCKGAGGSDALAQVPGMTTAMMVALGENGIKTLEDFADCATDDLVGWTERKKERDAEPVRHKGILDGFDVGRKEAEDMIMAARIILGWINPEDLEQPAEEAVEGAEAVEETTGEAGSSA